METRHLPIAVLFLERLLSMTYCAVEITSFCSGHCYNERTAATSVGQRLYYTRCVPYTVRWAYAIMLLPMSRFEYCVMD